VKKKLPTVYLVKLTELTHQNVVVLPDTSKKLTDVLVPCVQQSVSLVTALLTVLNVTIHPTDTQLFVFVLMDTITLMDKSTVTNVPHNV
jgi:hypothetical protein